MARPPVKRRDGDVLHMETRTAVAHSGPLPSPEILAGYERLNPGTAAIIIAMAQEEQRNRHQLEAAAQQSDIAEREALAEVRAHQVRGVFRSDMAGQVLGAAVALLAIGAGVLSAYLGAHPAVSIAFVSLPLASIIRAIRSTGGKAERKD